MPESLVDEVVQEYQSQQWKPFPGAQTRFMASPAFEVFFGGAAGPGKTECLVMDALRQVTNPQYRGVIFRRTMTELDDADGPIQRSHRWYPLVGGIWKEGKKKWIFPDPNSPRRIGAEIYFHHMEHEQDRFKYQGAQYQYIGFDELTHFTEKQYIYLFSRARTTLGSGLKTYIRSASNPGGEGHVWVRNRFVKRGITNEIGWFIRKDDVDIAVTANTPNAKSRTFIPATILDNPMIPQDYIDNLMSLPEIERKRLLDGNWDAEYKGRVYNDFGDENITMDAEYDPNYPFEVWIDDGYHHPRAMLFVQERPMRGFPDRLCIFHEIYETGVLHKDAIEHMLGAGYGEPERVYYDPNALYLQRELYDANIVHIAGYNNIPEGVKGVRQFIRDGKGVRTVYVHPRCGNTLREFDEYKLKESSDNEKEPLPEDKNNHTMDAIRYGIATSRMWDRWE